ncbi:Uncharacterised protein [Bordetella pertussis]|nr:Uncharacterised protein [Bordetella pertussis]
MPIDRTRRLASVSLYCMPGVTAWAVSGSRGSVRAGRACACAVAISIKAATVRIARVGSSNTLKPRASSSWRTSSQASRQATRT